MTVGNSVYAPAPNQPPAEGTQTPVNDAEYLRLTEVCVDADQTPLIFIFA